MRGNRKYDTSPELRLRSALHRHGFRFRKHVRVDGSNVRVTPDIVFPRRRLAVFVDGCFWHSCQEHGTRPRSNADYWSLKLARNRARDALVNRGLASAGWHVLRIWEHVPTDEAVTLVAAALGRGGVEVGSLK
jgi:DNA mismatch endonuclease, patch repair protein